MGDAHPTATFTPTRWHEGWCGRPPIGGGRVPVGTPATERLSTPTWPGSTVCRPSSSSGRVFAVATSTVVQQGWTSHRWHPIPPGAATGWSRRLSSGSSRPSDEIRTWGVWVTSICTASGAWRLTRCQISLRCSVGSTSARDSATTSARRREGYRPGRRLLQLLRYSPHEWRIRHPRWRGGASVLTGSFDPGGLEPRFP